MTARKIRNYLRETAYTQECGGSRSDALYAELTELERLAEIGRATEKAFERSEENETVFYIEYEKEGFDGAYSVIRNIQELLDWAETEGTK